MSPSIGEKTLQRSFSLLANPAYVVSCCCANQIVTISQLAKSLCARFRFSALMRFFLKIASMIAAACFSCSFVEVYFLLTGMVNMSSFIRLTACFWML